MLALGNSIFFFNHFAFRNDVICCNLWNFILFFFGSSVRHFMPYFCRTGKPLPDPTRKWLDATHPKLLPSYGEQCRKWKEQSWGLSKERWSFCIRKRLLPFWCATTTKWGRLFRKIFSTVIGNLILVVRVWSLKG